LEHSARALGMEAYLVSFDGAKTRAQNTALIAHALELAARSQSPGVMGWVKLVHGASLTHEGRFYEAQRVLVDALAWLLQHCSEVPFELAGTRVYTQNTQFHLGQHQELAKRAPALVEDALLRGDMYQSILLSTGFATPAWLSCGGLQLAGPHLDKARRRIQRQRQYQWSDYMLLLAELSAGLYEGRQDPVLQMADEQWSALEQSQLLRLQLCRALTHYTCGGAALARLRDGGGSAYRVRVDAHLGALRGLGIDYGVAFCAVLRAGLALHERKEAQAAVHLRAAIACFETCGMQMYAACARLRLGQLLGGEEGRASLRDAQATFVSQAVFDAESSAELFVPGCRVSVR
ncbi:MAG TPA: hypothetical protein VMF89_19995, partial [Polyangiales bacterium]|nr:hypothetical protein [Polyangiales bacterium]